MLEAEDVDTILHFAASTHVDNSFGNSLSFTMNNIVGTHVLLEAARQHGRIRRFIHVSTDEVYGTSPAAAAAEGGGGTDSTAAVGRQESSEARAAAALLAHQQQQGGGTIAEGSALSPTNPYSAAKAGAEMLVGAYATSYGLPCIITRSSNVYGPRQFPEKLVPKFTLLALMGQPLPVYGTGAQQRSYVYVEDVAEACDTILHLGQTGEVYHVCGQAEKSVVRERGRAMYRQQSRSRPACLRVN